MLEMIVMNYVIGSSLVVGKAGDIAVASLMEKRNSFYKLCTQVRETSVLGEYLAQDQNLVTVSGKIQT